MSDAQEGNQEERAKSGEPEEIVTRGKTFLKYYFVEINEIAGCGVQFGRRSYEAVNEFYRLQ